MNEELKCEYSSDGLCMFFEDCDLECNGTEEKNECAYYNGAYSVNNPPLSVTA